MTTPEAKARKQIDNQLISAGWIIQDMKKLNLTAGIGVAVREFPTSTGPVDYALFVEGIPVGIVEAKKTEAGENITVVENQSARYANSTFKWVQQDCNIRFAYEATDEYLLDKLKLEEEMWLKQYESADQIISDINSNSAVLNEPLILKKVY